MQGTSAQGQFSALPVKCWFPLVFRQKQPISKRKTPPGRGFHPPRNRNTLKQKQHREPSPVLLCWRTVPYCAAQADWKLVAKQSKAGWKNYYGTSLDKKIPKAVETFLGVPPQSAIQNQSRTWDPPLFGASNHHVGDCLSIYAKAFMDAFLCSCICWDGSDRRGLFHSKTRRDPRRVLFQLCLFFQ